MNETVEIGIQHRAATFAPSSFNRETRTVDVVWTTGAQVRRYSWARDEEFDEELVVEQSALRLGRLNSGAPFLNSHRSYGLESILGVVVEGSVRVNGGRGYATIRFSERPQVEGIIRDIEGGIIRNVSVGYRVHRFERVAAADRKDGGARALMRAVDWEPLEISAVAVGADAAAQVRGDTADLAPVIIERKRHMDGTTTSGTAAQTTTLTRADNPDAQEIRTIFSRHGMAQRGEALVDAGATLDQAREALLADLVRSDPAGRTVETATVGMDWNSGPGLRARWVDAIESRLDPNHPPTLGREFAQSELSDLCVAVAESRGERVSSRREAVQIVQRGYHTASDFALITADAMSNVVARQFAQRVPDLARASREIPRDTYHQGKSLTLSASGMPQEIEEAGEIEFVTMDEKGEALPTPRDFGAGFNLSNKAIANDRLDLLTQATDRMVRGAVERLRRVLLEPLEANSGAGQTMADGQPMFHTSRGNTTGTGAALSVTSLSEARVALRKARGLQGELYAIEPWALVVPAELETVAQQVVAEIQATKFSDANPFSGKLEIIVEPGLADDGGWYLIGNPAVHDGLAHAFLTGQNAPRVESRPAWETLGMQYRLVWAVDAKFIETAAWFRNPGV